MIVVPVKTKIYDFKMFYGGFLITNYFNHSNNTYSMFLITLLFNRMPVKPKPRKLLYFKSGSMPLPSACWQNQQVYLRSKTLRNKKYVNRSSFFSNVATIGLQLYYKLIPVFSRFLITVQNQKRIQNPVKHLRWCVLLEYVLGFSR